MTGDRDRPIRLLLIGSLPPPLGGTAVLFQQLISELQRHADVDTEVIDASRGDRAGAGAGARAALRVAWSCMGAMRRADVVTLHASTPGTVFFGPLLYLLSRILHRPMILREFGGSLDDEFAAMPWPARQAVRLTFRCERALLETHRLVNFFQRTFPFARCEWYSNSRPLPAQHALPPSSAGQGARRFVFVGHVKASKGVREILAAAERLPEECSVDVYGPLLDGFPRAELDRSARVAYRGVLAPENVLATLRESDVVLLPTTHYGEGYPGIILEAYTAGRPVIATRWRSIPEIVEDGVSGILVEPGDVEGLAAAMTSLSRDGERLRSLGAGAAALAERFSSTRWTSEFVRICREVEAERG